MKQIGHGVRRPSVFLLSTPSSSAAPILPKRSRGVTEPQYLLLSESSHCAETNAIDADLGLM